MAVKPAAIAAAANAARGSPQGRAEAAGSAEGVAEALMFEVPARFNAATFFVDRHVAEGRGGQGRLLPRRAGRSPTRGLQELVNRTGNALLDLGVRPEQRVLCLLLDSPEFLGAFWGAIKIGAVPIPAEHDAAGRRLPLLPRRQPRAGRCRLGGAAGRGGAGAARRRAISGTWSSPGKRVRRRTSPSRAGWPRPPRGSSRVDTSKDDAAFWLYSSGSTGRPKGAVHLQHDMVVCADAYALGVLGMTEADRTVSAAKLFFAYGLGNNMYFPHRAWAGRACSTRIARRPTRCSS